MLHVCWTACNAGRMPTLQPAHPGAAPPLHPCASGAISITLLSFPSLPSPQELLEAAKASLDHPYREDGPPLGHEFDEVPLLLGERAGPAPVRFGTASGACSCFPRPCCWPRVRPRLLPNRAVQACLFWAALRVPVHMAASQRPTPPRSPSLPRPPQQARPAWASAPAAAGRAARSARLRRCRCRRALWMMPRPTRTSSWVRCCACCALLRCAVFPCYVSLLCPAVDAFRE